MSRSVIELPCPWHQGQKPVVVVATAWQSQYGIAHPENTGDCPLVIVALDARGKHVRTYPFYLQPGESSPWYYPPEGTAKIVTAGFENCSGMAILEFETPSW